MTGPKASRVLEPGPQTYAFHSRWATTSEWNLWLRQKPETIQERPRSSLRSRHCLNVLLNIRQKLLLKINFYNFKPNIPIVSLSLSPRNGEIPANKTYIRAPTLHISAANVTVWPSATSGATNLKKLRLVWCYNIEKLPPACLECCHVLCRGANV